VRVRGVGRRHAERGLLLCLVTARGVMAATVLGDGTRSVPATLGFGRWGGGIGWCRGILRRRGGG
jgi:hypothetical protein